MPTYEYACKACEHRFEIHQSFTDDALTTCPECGGALRKVFGNIGITFKGSGFYKTDSRSSSSASASSSRAESSGDRSSTPSESSANSSASSTSTSSDSSSSSSSSTSSTPATSTPAPSSAPKPGK